MSILKRLEEHIEFHEAIDKHKSDAAFLRILKAYIEEREEAAKALLQELIECSYDLQCSCGHPACKPCERYGQLVEFIELMKKTI